MADSVSERIVSCLREAANQIPEPCGMAQGLSIGMVDMGLIRDID